jgi:hypothetical protein
MKRIRSTPILLAFLLLSGGCGSILDVFGDAEKGSLSLRYEGVESGSLSAAGVRQEEWTTRSHASGLAYRGVMQVFALHRLAPGRYHHFFIIGSVNGTGTFAFDPHRGDETFYAELALDVRDSENSARSIYVLTEGTVRIESLRGDRIRGSFDGNARELTGGAVIRIRDGRFDVPMNLPRPVE